MNGSASWTTLGVKAVTITRRTRLCSGGSSSPRMRSSNGITTPGAFIPEAFENDVGITQHRATRIVLRHVRHPAGDRRDRALLAQLAQQREVVTATATERIEVGGVGHAGIVANLGRLRVQPDAKASLEVLDDVLRVRDRQAVAFELDA